MNAAQFHNLPLLLTAIEQKCIDIGFTMPSDRYIGALLKTLVASKPGGNCLELGTGIGLSLVWLIDGLTIDSKITSIDNDANLIEIARDYFAADSRVQLICQDGSKWLENYEGPSFDLVFADAWPGKYSDLEKTLALVSVGGFYVVDDMLPQPNWPEGHEERAAKLVQYLEQRRDFHLTKMNWSTGVIVMTKLAN